MANFPLKKKKKIQTAQGDCRETREANKNSELTKPHILIYYIIVNVNIIVSIVIITKKQPIIHLLFGKSEELYQNFPLTLSFMVSGLSASLPTELMSVRFLSRHQTFSQIPLLLLLLIIIKVQSLYCYPSQISCQVLA